MKINLNTREKFIFFGVGVVIFLFPLLLVHDFGLVSFMDTGQIGDTIGGITAPFLSFFGAILIYSALKAQVDANNQIQQQFKVQQFESQFYKMVDLHTANVEGFNIPFYDTINNKNDFQFKLNINKEKEPISFFRELKGKSSFVDMIKELEFCLESAASVSEVMHLAKPNVSHFNLAFKIFFFGVYSDEVNVKNEEYDTLSQEMINYLKDQQGDFREDEKPFFKRNVGIRYIPFQGHESRLGHYNRHLFQTVKYVANQENHGLIDYAESRQYFRLLRAQLSNAEQLMLYYNYICGFGENWNNPKMGYEFLTKYRFIHNMPVDRVKIVPKPRDHFKDYICNHCNSKDPLFEWGDRREDLGCND